MTSTPRKSVLLIGLDPKVVDYTQFPGLDEHKLAAGLQAALDQLDQAGFAAEWCLTDHVWASAEPQIRARFAAKRFAAVLVGAGVRLPAAHFLLFEQIVNLIHSAAPDAKLCFNTSPHTTAEAVLRWIQP